VGGGQDSHPVAKEAKSLSYRDLRGAEVIGISSAFIELRRDFYTRRSYLGSCVVRVSSFLGKVL